MSFLLIFLLRLYQGLISPILVTIAPGMGCRFKPTCSQYMILSIRRHGPSKGVKMGLKQLAACHPFH